MESNEHQPRSGEKQAKGMKSRQTKNQNTKEQIPEINGPPCANLTVLSDHTGTVPSPCSRRTRTLTQWKSTIINCTHKITQTKSVRQSVSLPGAAHTAQNRHEIRVKSIMRPIDGIAHVWQGTPSPARPKTASKPSASGSNSREGHLTIVQGTNH